MPAPTACALLAGFAACVASFVALRDMPADKTDAAAIAHWIGQLGDDDFDKREEASQKLAAIGEPALPALQEAAEKEANPEARSRAGKLAEAIAKSVYPELRSISGGTPGYWWNRVAFTPDGKQAVVAGGGVFLYDLDNGKELYRGVMEQQYARRGLCLSTDGKQFLTGHQSDSVVRLAEVATGKQIRTFVGHTGGVWGTALSPDGALAVSGGDDKTLRIWEVKTGKEQRRCEGVADTPLCLAFGPQGARFASGHGGADSSFLVRLWDAGTGKEVRAFKGHTQNVTSIAFVSDEKYLLSSSMDGTIRLWDVESGKVVQQMKHEGGVYDAAASPDGTRALSAGFSDKTVRLWDLTTGKEIHRFTAHQAGVLAVAISRDGKRGLSCDANQTMKLWQLAK
ncbi:MAG TPA: WD40 repeat domain-containing protein [Gemmataceae bacterium]|nr:WD40 repeat domain-containing protein [Gemmataceae bacterium]